MGHTRREGHIDGRCLQGMKMVVILSVVNSRGILAFSTVTGHRPALLILSAGRERHPPPPWSPWEWRVWCASSRLVCSNPTTPAFFWRCAHSNFISEPSDSSWEETQRRGGGSSDCPTHPSAGMEVLQPNGH